MKLFSRTTEEPAASVKQTRKGVTCGEVSTAIMAICAEMGDCTTGRTLDALLYDSAIRADAGSLVRFNGPISVSLAQFDEALADLNNYDLPADTLSPLKRLRILIANAEKEETKAAGTPVTRAEFDALVEAVAIVVLNIDAAQERKGYPDGRVSARLEMAVAASRQLNVSNAVTSMLQKITGQISTASKNNDARERARAKPYVAISGNGRNF